MKTIIEQAIDRTIALEHPILKKKDKCGPITF